MIIPRTYMWAILIAPVGKKSTNLVDLVVNFPVEHRVSSRTLIVALYFVIVYFCLIKYDDWKGIVFTFSRKGLLFPCLWQPVTLPFCGESPSFDTLPKRAYHVCNQLSDSQIAWWDTCDKEQSMLHNGPSIAMGPDISACHPRRLAKLVYRSNGILRIQRTERWELSYRHAYVW